MHTINKLRNQLERQKGRRSQLLKDLKATRNKVKVYRREVKISEEARLIIQHVAKQTQKEIEYQLSELITLSMQAIIDEPCEFVVKFTIRREKTECDLFFLKTGELYDPMEDEAGGIIDIAAFALQIALLRISYPPLRYTFITDEPLKHLSKDYHEKAGIVLKELTSRMKPKLQVIMITHSTDLAEQADRIFRVRKIKGISRIKRIRK